jgi:hypothetical protein
MSETVLDLQTLPALKSDEGEGGGGGGSSCVNISVICCTFTVCQFTL